MHTLVSDAALAAGRARHSSRRSFNYLLPAALVRWYVRRRLSRGEAYIFDLLRTIKHNSVIGDIIISATRRPTVDDFQRIMAHLASQCNDSPRTMTEIVGEELVLILRAQGALYRLDQKFSGVAVVDLRHLNVGARFRVRLNDLHVYRLIENGPQVVMYMRDGLIDANLRAYPKEEGPINVYLEPSTSTT